MALIKNDSSTYLKDDSCFLCGETLEKVYIFWQGGNGDALALHPTCCQYLGLSLLKDYFSYSASSEGMVPTCAL